MTDRDVTATDVDTLWEALVVARKAGDHERVRAIEGRMRTLQGPVRFAAMSDEELDARIAAIDGNRAPTGLLAYSPGGNEGMDAGIADLPRLNRAIVAQQHVGLEAQRTQLLDERARRGRGEAPRASGPRRPSFWARLTALVRGR